MNGMFSRDNCISHSGPEVREFVEDVLLQSKKVLFIGTVGLESSSLYFPLLLAPSQNVHFGFIVERRPSVQVELVSLGERHRAHLLSAIGASRAQFVEIDVVASDGATIAGRTAIGAAANWLKAGYTDIVVDATGMSRGTCFPIAKQAMLFARQQDANMHLVVAGNRRRALEITGDANDRADWVYGFQGPMGSDRSSDLMKLWIPQLSEGMKRPLELMYGEIQEVAEVCPILPFPSYDPKRGDRLLWEHHEAIRDQWETGPLDLIYAHETDPMDVYRTISRLHQVRERVFGHDGRKTVSILSPSGWRVGSVGMLLAAIEHELPMLYVETVGYNCKSAIPAVVDTPEPDVSWHLWLTGHPYTKHVTS
jgi:hypothetical protein